MASALNFRTSLCMQHVRKQKHRRNDQSGERKLSRVMLDKQIRAHFKYYQIKIHIQAACESHDLNMDFRSFDNGFKQLCVTNFM